MWLTAPGTTARPPLRIAAGSPRQPSMRSLPSS
jgi:hypothetical protein